MTNLTDYNGKTFCTLAGQQYLLKLLALHQSLCNTAGDFHLIILCIDDTTFWFLQKAALNHVTLVHVSQIENDALLQVKPYRQTNEYCWTLKAPFMLYILNQINARNVVYCDSDIYFFADPQPMFDALTRCSIYLCPQRDAEDIERMYGKYQAGIVGFRNDNIGKAALEYWFSKCLEKCCASLQPDDTFGDQKYLEHLAAMFPEVYCETHIGIDAAPWNCVYRNTGDFNVQNNRPYLQSTNIVAFHFATLIQFNEDEYDLWSYGALNMPNTILNHLYVPYIEALRKALSFLRTVDAHWESIVYSQKPVEGAATYFRYSTQNVSMLQFDENFLLCSIVTEAYLTRAMALYASIKQHNQNFHMWLCAVDDGAERSLEALRLKHATIVPLRDLMTPQLEQVRQSRSVKEFCWTLKSFFVQHLFQNLKLKRVLYLDCDMYLYTDLKYIFREWHTYSFMMCTQRADVKTEKECGYYQAGLLGIKNDDYGNRVLNWWKDRCFEWCYNVRDEQNNRFGDQKYLEKVPYDFENIKVVTNFGINAAPWNLILNDSGYDITLENNQVFMNNVKLCAFHFGSIGINGYGNYDIWVHHPVNPNPALVELVYQPYFAQLDRMQGILSGIWGMGCAFDDLL